MESWTEIIESQSIQGVFFGSEEEYYKAMRTGLEGIYFPKPAISSKYEVGVI